MIDEIMDVCQDALKSFFVEADKALDSFLDDLSPEDFRYYARLGVLVAMEEVIKRRDMEE